MCAKLLSAWHVFDMTICEKCCGIFLIQSIAFHELWYFVIYNKASIFKMGLCLRKRSQFGALLVFVFFVVESSSVRAHPFTDNSYSPTRLFRRTRSTSDADVTIPSYRLPKSVLPEKYFLTITPILQQGFEESFGEQWSAPGSVVISVQAVKPVDSITLHAKNITLHNVTVCLLFR